MYSNQSSHIRTHVDKCSSSNEIRGNSSKKHAFISVQKNYCKVKIKLNSRNHWSNTDTEHTSAHVPVLTNPPIEIPVRQNGPHPCSSHQWSSTTVSNISAPPITIRSLTFWRLERLQRQGDWNSHTKWHLYTLFLPLNQIHVSVKLYVILTIGLLVSLNHLPYH